VAKRFADKLAEALGLEVTEDAEAVIRLANTKRAGAIRMVSLSLGMDPRDFALFAFGGAGPLHAASLARELGVPRVLVPARPGITNAIGCVVADLRHDFVQTVACGVDALDAGQLAGVFASQVAEGEALIAQERLEPKTIRHLYSVDMQYAGQTHLLRVSLDRPDVTGKDLLGRFQAAYFERFRVALDGVRAIVVNANCSVIGVREALDLSTLIDPGGRKSTVEEAIIGSRHVRFSGEWYQTPVYARDFLPLDAVIAGPAIVEQMDTTVVIEPSDRAQGDAHGNLIIHLGDGA